MAFVVDKGLDKLLAQINAAAPGRSKASDGSIGDLAHQGTDSDHNPEDDGPGGNPEDQVDARDFTHDPGHNADMAVVSESIRVSRDRRVSYVIFNRRIYSGADGPAPWVWRAYTGDNPHIKHMHVSARDDTHDQTQDWTIGIDMPTVSEIWNTDGMIANQGGTGGDTVQPSTGLERAWRAAQDAENLGQQNKAGLAEVRATLARIEALLTGGVTVSAQVDLTPEALAATAEATADELAARAQD